MIFISHRLNEVEQCADRVVVLRDGASSASLAASEIEPRRDDPPDDRPRPEIALHPAASAARRGVLEVAGLGRLRYPGPRRRPVAARAARSSAWPAWSAPAAPSLPAPSSASTGRSAARSRSTARRCHRARRATRSTTASTSCPEDRKRAGLVLEMSVDREHLACRTCCAFARRLLIDTRRRAPERRASSAQRSTSRPPSVDDRGRHAVGRQPAEGRARQMAVDEAEGHDLRRADARHRRRREVGDLRADARARRLRASPILMISSDMEEVIGVSDRIAVMHEGRDQRLPRARPSSARRT